MILTEKALNYVIDVGGSMGLYRLFTPGPVDLPEIVLRASARQCIYHREERFKVLMDEITDGLSKIIMQ